MDYETNRETLYEQIEDVCKLFPNRSLGEVLGLATGRDLFFLTDNMLGQQLKDFYLQNM